MVRHFLSFCPRQPFALSGRAQIANRIEGRYGLERSLLASFSVLFADGESFRHDDIQPCHADEREHRTQISFGMLGRIKSSTLSIFAAPCDGQDHPFVIRQTLGTALRVAERLPRYHNAVDPRLELA